jgi:hypothetical protein
MQNQVVIFTESPSFADRVFELLTEEELIALEDRLLATEVDHEHK